MGTNGLNFLALLGSRLMVGQRILVPYVRVQLLPPQPEKRPHRLTVRTLASHVGSPGSNPGGVTKQ